MIALAILLATAAVVTNVPRLEDCRVVYVHEPGTTVLNAPDGTVCIDQEPRPFHDECRARYAKREMPFPYRRLREYMNTNEFLPAGVELQAIDARGRPWFRKRPTNTGIPNLFHITQGVLHGEEHPDLFWPNKFLVSPRGVSRDVLTASDGSVLAVGREGLYRAGKEEEPSVMFPVPLDRVQADNLFGRSTSVPNWTHQVYRLGESVWVVRVVSFADSSVTPGSFVLRVVGDEAKLVAWLSGQFVTGLVQHENGVYALVDSSYYTPQTILQLSRGLEADKPVAVVRQKIAELDGEWAVREAASKYLTALPPSYLELLREVWRTTKSPEQKFRLQDAISAILVQPETPAMVKLGGAMAGRLQMMDRLGQQYVQVWENGPSHTMLVFNRQGVATVRLPKPDFQLDCQGDDGLLYGHDTEFLYRLDPEKPPQLVPIAVLPPTNVVRHVSVVATWKGRLCVRMGEDEQDPCVWFDLRAQSVPPSLTGETIAENVIAPRNGFDKHYPVAVGPAGRLWFLSRHDRMMRTGYGTRVETKFHLHRADVVKTTEMGGSLVVAGRANVWPLTADAALVVALDNDEETQAVFCDRGQLFSYPSLHALVEAQYERLGALMPDGLSLRSGEDDIQRTSLTRLGDSFYVEGTHRALTNDSSSVEARSGIFRCGQWREQKADTLYEPLINRLSGVDIATHRLLGFQDAWKALHWIPLASDAGKAEELARQSEAWAWHWYDHTHLPRYAGAWTLTPEAATCLIAITPQRQAESKQRGEDETRFNSADFANLRTWANGRWRESGFSCYGSEPWSDASGGVWFFRVREVEVLFHDGHRLLIPLDAGYVDRYRLAIESPDAVWVASQESLTRFRLERDKNQRPSRWVSDRVFRLPAFGLGFAGPWIAGDDLYYVSDGKLFHVALAELLRASVPHH